MAPYCVVQIHYEMRKTSQSMPITLNGPHSNRKCRLTENPNKVALPFQTPQTLHRTVNTLSFHHSAKNTTSQPPLTPPCTQPNIHSWTQTHNSSDTPRHSTSQYTVIPSLSQEHNQPAPTIPQTSLRHSTSQYTVIPSLSQEHNQPAPTHPTMHPTKQPLMHPTTQCLSHPSATPTHIQPNTHSCTQPHNASATPTHIQPNTHSCTQPHNASAIPQPPQHTSNQTPTHAPNHTMPQPSLSHPNTHPTKHPLMHPTTQCLSHPSATPTHIQPNTHSSTQPHNASAIPQPPHQTSNQTPTHGPNHNASATPHPTKHLLTDPTTQGLSHPSKHPTKHLLTDPTTMPQPSLIQPNTY